MVYKHGRYTEDAQNAGNLLSAAVGTVPCYIGTAPIHLTESTVGKVNTPILITSYRDAVNKIGYSDDWAKFTLCEAVYAHFMNSNGAIAPIIVINMNDGESGEDFDIATGVTAEAFALAIKALDSCEIMCNIVPNIICAPAISHTYAKELEAVCTSKIAEKWGCVAYIDIPTETAKDGATALTWKTTNAVASKFVRPHFPKAKFGGKVYHLSTLDAVASQKTDAESDGVACHSSSNKVIDCDVPCIDATTNLIFSEKEANALNEKGITTINYIGGSFRVWGGHMANYDYSKINDILPQDRSDATVRMGVFLHNWLKSEHLAGVDFPMSRRDIDNIISNVNIGMNSFVKNGYLLYGNCYFDSANNTAAELSDGDLKLNIQYTNTPNGKSVTFILQYTPKGLEMLFAETEGV